MLKLLYHCGLGMSIGVFEYFLNFLANREKGVKKYLSAASGGTSPLREGVGCLLYTSDYETVKAAIEPMCTSVEALTTGTAFAD